MKRKQLLFFSHICWWFQLNLSFANSVEKLLLVSVGKVVGSVEAKTFVNEEQKNPAVINSTNLHGAVIFISEMCSDY